LRINKENNVCASSKNVGGNGAGKIVNRDKENMKKIKIA